jgi:SAM-dependent methyltransferase
MSRDDAEALFSGAAHAYATYRTGFPEELFNAMTRELGFTPGTRIADLGCGPGTTSIPLARRVGTVLAVDANAEMLAAARAAALRAGLATIEFRCGHARDLPRLDPGPVEHGVFARSFHWTNRDAVVLMLDVLLPRHGAIVLIGRAPSAQGPRWPWSEAVREVRERFLGPERLAGNSTFQRPATSHTEILAARGFTRIERHTFTETIELDLDHVVGLQTTYSYSTARLLGDRVGQFQHQVRDAVTRACGPGPYRIAKHDQLLIARRAHHATSHATPHSRR